MCKIVSFTVSSTGRATSPTQWYSISPKQPQLSFGIASPRNCQSLRFHYNTNISLSMKMTGGTVEFALNSTPPTNYNNNNNNNIGVSSREYVCSKDRIINQSSSFKFRETMQKSSKAFIAFAFFWKILFHQTNKSCKTIRLMCVSNISWY